MPAALSAALPRSMWVPVVCVALLAAGAIGCGKKGPPLAPLISVPVAPTEVSARRAGDEVVIQFTVPAANASGVRPADLSRVDVYAWTGATLPRDEVFEHATVVASVPVRRPPPPAPEGETAPVVRTPPEPGLDQGAPAEVREHLHPDALVPLELRDDGKQETKDERPPAVVAPDLGPVMEELPSRHYVVVGVNRRGRRGTPANPVVVPLWASPRPPVAPQATVSEKAITLEWTPPEGVRVSIQPPTLAKPPAAAPPKAPARSRGPAREEGGDPSPPAADARPSEVDEQPDDLGPDADEPRERQKAKEGEEAEVADDHRPPDAEQVDVPETQREAEDDQQQVEPAERPSDPNGGVSAPGDARLPSRLLFPWPAGSTGYRVYEVLPPGAEVPDVPPPPAQQPYPRLLTPKPLATTTFADTRLEFGTERCYVVRTVETVGRLSAESPAAGPVCVKPVDVFPPAAPRSLGAVASERAISLIWDRSTEPDLAGYIVLRSEAPGDPVEPITPEPIKETTFRDTNVAPGTRYVYVVVAVDSATPPNASPPSNRVEETAR